MKPLETLERIEALARELGKELSPGLARQRAQHIAVMAASAALEVRIAKHAANDAEKERACAGADSRGGAQKLRPTAAWLLTSKAS